MRRLERTRRLSSSDRQLMLDLKSIIALYAENATVVLYGSAARGTRDRESDYDLLIVPDTPMDRQAIENMRAELYELELKRGVVVSVSIIPREEWESPVHRVSAYHRRIEADGVVL